MSLGQLGWLPLDHTLAFCFFFTEHSLQLFTHTDIDSIQHCRQCVIASTSVCQAAAPSLSPPLQIAFLAAMVENNTLLPCERLR